jgi:hypothetical protein
MARNEKGEVVFDADEQAKVDAIVQERVARVKTEKPADYDELVAIKDELVAFNFTGTPAEIRAQVRAQREEAQRQAQVKELEAQAAETGASPELLKKIAALEKKQAEYDAEREATKAEQAKKQKEEADIQAQFEAFDATYPDVDRDALLKDAKFMRFAKGKAMPLTEVYADYAELMDKAEIAALAKARDKEDRGTGSGKGRSDGGTYGLTPRQQELARENNMDFKEYADLLSNIKKG